MTAAPPSGHVERSRDISASPRALACTLNPEIPRQARDDSRAPLRSCRAQSRHLGAYPMARLQEQAQIPRPAFAQGYGGQARLGMTAPMRAKSQLAFWP